MICWSRTSCCGAAAVFPFCDLRIATGWPAPAPAACGPADWVPCAHAAALGACSCMPPTHASAHACASGGNAKTQPRVQTAGRSGGGVSQRRRGAQQRSAGRCRAGPLGVSRGSRRLKRNTRTRRGCYRSGRPSRVTVTGRSRRDGCRRAAWHMRVALFY